MSVTFSLNSRTMLKCNFKSVAKIHSTNKNRNLLSSASSKPNRKLFSGIDTNRSQLAAAW